MNAISPLAILLFGIAIGVCLPSLLTFLRQWLRHLRFRPTLLKLDPAPQVNEHKSQRASRPAGTDAPQD